MEVVWRYAEVSIFRGWNPELAPESVNVLLLIIDTSELHQVEARGGVCPIGTDEVVEGHLDLRYSTSYTGIVGHRCLTGNSALKPGFVSSKVSTCQLVVEK